MILCLLSPGLKIAISLLLLLFYLLQMVLLYFSVRGHSALEYSFAEFVEARVLQFAQIKSVADVTNTFELVTATGLWVRVRHMEAL